MTQRLVDVERTVAEKWTGTTAIVLVDRTHCLRCKGKLETDGFRQPALFWSHGYGATLETTFVRCTECSWFFMTDTTEVKPDDQERAIARRRTA